MAVELTKVEVDKTLYCWSYGELDHGKKNCRLKQKNVQTMRKPKRKTIVSAKSLIKDVGKPSPK